MSMRTVNFLEPGFLWDRGSKVLVKGSEVATKVKLFVDVEVLGAEDW